MLACRSLCAGWQVDGELHSSISIITRKNRKKFLWTYNLKNVWFIVELYMDIQILITFSTRL